MIVTLCGWCPDAKEKTAALVAAGHLPSHTICPTCMARLFPESEDAKASVPVKDRPEEHGT